VADIDVARNEDGSTFRVLVTDRVGTTEHQVSLGEVGSRLAEGYPSEEVFVEACFEFLLAREPKEQILREFEIGVISRYFPEFEQELARR
jgi:hypothetical protein